MKHTQTFRPSAIWSLILTSTVLVACGGSSTGDNAGTVVSRGIITGFGSVFVNGIKFKTTGASISVDDEAGNESSLRVGMIVTVKGR